MKIENQALLLSLQLPGRCECCSKKCKAKEGHHVFSRGAGRLDILVNLVSLGASRPFPQCTCHGDAHAGVLMLPDLLAIVSVRENVLASDIVDIVHCFRRLPKQPRKDEIEKEIADLSQRARAIVTQELRRMELWT